MSNFLLIIVTVGFALCAKFWLPVILISIKKQQLISKTILLSFSSSVIGILGIFICGYSIESRFFLPLNDNINPKLQGHDWRFDIFMLCVFLFGLLLCFLSYKGYVDASSDVTADKNGPKRLISTDGSTFIMKFIAPPFLAILAYGFFRAALYKEYMTPSPGLEKLIQGTIVGDIIYFFMGAVITLYVIPSFATLKKVYLDTDKKGIYISNYFREIFVPFIDIERIEDARGIKMKCINVFFKEKTIFGKKISFLPDERNLSGPGMLIKISDIFCIKH